MQSPISGKNPISNILKLRDGKAISYITGQCSFKCQRKHLCLRYAFMCLLLTGLRFFHVEH